MLQDLNFYQHEVYIDFSNMPFYPINIECETTSNEDYQVWCPHSYPWRVKRGFGQTNGLCMALLREILTITNIAI